MRLSKEQLIKGSYTMPFEGEEHLGTIIELPFRKDVWREGARPAFLEFLSLIKVISEYEKVYLVISKKALEAHGDSIKSQLKHSNVEILKEEYDDSWARDNTPLFVRNEKGDVVGVNFGFNAWGGTYNGLYSSWKEDNALGSKLLSSLKIREYKNKDFILEGGSVHTNGQGTLLTTEECLLSKGRNPLLTKSQIEEVLKESLGQKKVLWLPYGVYNDETSGHIDNMACFLDETHVLLASTEDKNDPMYERYREDLKVLENATTADGKKIEVIPIPLPGPLYMTEEEEKSLRNDNQAKTRKAGDRLAASYVNFYMGKDYVILPKFDDKNDSKAYQILDSFYKGRKKILQLPGREILLGGGNIHCITKQIPSGKKGNVSA